MKNTNDASALAQHWALDPDVVFLNHGSFGACPNVVLLAQTMLRKRMEREPILFLDRQLEENLDRSRAELAALVGADAEDIAFVPNATTGVNAVLRSLDFRPGDELLITDHAYNACRNTLFYCAEKQGATAVVAKVPFPVSSPDEIVEIVLRCATPRTRLALIDHITSPTAIILPVERIVRELAARGIDTLVDGAHGPGMLPLDLRSLGAAYYTGNCHKWLCSPKGAGFLHVRRDKQKDLHPTTISHGLRVERPGRSRFLLEFDWTGTHDFSPYLCVSESIRFMGSLFPGGWAELMQRNYAMAVQARGVLCEALCVEPPCPEDMLGSMAALPLPADISPAAAKDARFDPLQMLLFERYKIETPVISWPAHPARLIRVCAQVYNSMEQYRHLADALRELMRKSPS